MLFQGYHAELLFGESEVLVAAKHLVDGQLVTRETGGTVTYIHMMFEQHERSDVSSYGDTARRCARGFEAKLLTGTA